MKRPNILYIMADDHTSQAWGCFGSRLAPYISTPNIDRLAAEGARLRNCFCTNQGYFLGEHNLFDKRFMLEESLRMPFVIRYPRETAPGTVSDDIVTNVDFAELVLDYADAEILTPEDLVVPAATFLRDTVRGIARLLLCSRAQRTPGCRVRRLGSCGARGQAHSSEMRL